MPEVQPYAERLARYTRAVSMREAGSTLEEISIALGLTRERVRQILAKPPGGVGRPVGSFGPHPPKKAKAAKALADWEHRREVALATGGDTTFADRRIAELREKIGEV